MRLRRCGGARATSGATASAGCSLVAIAAAVLLALLPLWGSTTRCSSWSRSSCYVSLAQMWNLLAGYAGLVSIGQQAFVGSAPTR